MNNRRPQFNMNLVPKFKIPMPQGGGGGKFLILGTLIVGAGVLVNGFYTVEGGHSAIVFNRIGGLSDEIIHEGLKFALPWFQRPIVFDIRSRYKSLTSLTGSRDLQMVNISLRVLFKPDPRRLPTIYRTLGMDYDQRVLPSIGNEVLKSVVAQFNASELLTKREQVSREIRNRLTERAKDFHLILDDVSITHLAFGREYTAAVEAKQVAQQEAERAKFVVEKALQDKKSTIIRAEGEARSALMIGEAMRNNPGFLEIRRVEAAKDIAGTMSNAQNRVFLSSDSLMLDLMRNVGFGGAAAATNFAKEHKEKNITVNEITKIISGHLRDAEQQERELNNEILKNELIK